MSPTFGLSPLATDLSSKTLLIQHTMKRVSKVDNNVFLTKIKRIPIVCVLFQF